MNNFKTRTFSGIIFVVTLIGAILLSPYTFVALFSVIAGMAIYEFHTITNNGTTINVNKTNAIIGAVLLFLISYLYNANMVGHQVFSIYGIYYIILIISELFRKNKNPIYNWAYATLGQIGIALPFALLNYLLYAFGHNPMILIALFVTIWINDTGAFVAGSTLGRHKLFARISPKKTWEGFIGGAIFAILSGYIFSRYIIEFSTTEWIIFSEIVVISGTFGDLMESLLKRTENIKDSGNVIPGHGGVLDRFDSMLLAAPAILIYIVLLHFDLA